ncbi:MAG TPA: four helix bundle protein [Chitinophagaceae bacterium]|nr:four helix bundle protein [Chitinophagaceae bacterium]
MGIVEEGSKPYDIGHRCYFFSRSVIDFVKEKSCDYVFSSLYSQLVRSATSIGANMIEGKASSSKKEWQKFALTALRSSNESKYWLCLIRDSFEFDRTKIQELIKEADEISKIIGTIILNSKK